jgi:hypothetical protein
MTQQEYYFILAILFLGGFIGWSLFAYIIIKSICNRHIELAMIKDISTELEKAKEDLQKLK